MMQLDSVQIGAPDVDETAAAYRLLLGVEPAPLLGGGVRFQLGRGAVELAPGDPGVRAIRFVGERPATWPASFHGVAVLLDAAPAVAPEAPAAAPAIDHVVVQTPDPERAIALWRDRVGLRLALDRVFPERGLRLLFFRSGGITLEFAAAHPPGAPEGPDRLWGVSYRVPDLAAARERLVAAGVDVSAARAGIRPGTSVASVRSGTAGVPTLLLQAHPE
jgi:catechol 2,3-dioxygenase-like lactoylglutathione lyase family enzyme